MFLERIVNHKYFDVFLIGGVVAAGAVLVALVALPGPRPAGAVAPAAEAGGDRSPRLSMDTSGFSEVVPAVEPWAPDAPLEAIAGAWSRVSARLAAKIDGELAQADGSPAAVAPLLLMKATLRNYDGDAEGAARLLEELRALAEGSEPVARRLLYTIIYYQGVTALRRGENDNCIRCRGESSCILPISRAAVHVNTEGSRAAVGFFTEYLRRFPDDLQVRWLLNLAHMTLGEYPQGVDPRYLVRLDRYLDSESDIGRFRDVGERLGVNRLNQAGGAILDDFDGDGRLDLFVTSLDPTMEAALYRNRGDGTFEERIESAGLGGQLGGLVCYQTDYDNDGLLDVFIPRGAWLLRPIRPSLLHNDGGTFTDVTDRAGLAAAFNSNAAAWADYDNDGFLDLFVACELGPDLLYHNRGDGTFEEVAASAGVSGPARGFEKGCNWIDFDNDRDPDLFVNDLAGPARLYRNEGDGRFADVTLAMNIRGPSQGFSCWSWDFDNDGWLDLFATSYDRTNADLIGGLLGMPATCEHGRLYRNRQGRGFEDVTTAAGLDGVYAAMGTNFGDLDNDGYLDFYLGTGEPSIATLVPNRMFRNVAGRRFAEITGSSGTGHLQKGHAVAIGDWDRDGDADVFIQMGGAIHGDRYHNIMFENPGRGHHWLTVRLVGERTNRAAIGARIKVVTGGDAPLTVHRHVTSGSSFGANPLEQTIGLGASGRVATLEVEWPTSGTTQVFRDVPVDRSIEVVEFSDAYRTLDAPPLRPPG
jgi:hypothetical protein